jgi:phosphate-selective porin OprO/OprP
MDAKRLAFAAGLGCIALLSVAHTTRAEEPRVVDQLLDILRKNKQITEQQYRDLKQQAEEERQQDLRKLAPPADAVAPVAAAPTAPPPSPDVRAYFKNGFVFGERRQEILNNGRRSSAGRLEHLHAQPRRVSGIRAGSTFTGVEFRRARLSIQGLVFGNVDYKIEYDFATGEADAKDVYLGVLKLPVVQYVRIGHFKEPFSLEELTSDSFTTFMERGLPNAFSPSRNMGIAAMPTFFDQHMTFFRRRLPRDQRSGLRFQYRPTIQRHGARHRSAPLRGRGQRSGPPRLRLQPQVPPRREHLVLAEARVTPVPVALVNTGNIETDGVDLINPEVAWVHGPLSLQGEYQGAFVSQVDHSNPYLGGFYLFASYFLTPRRSPRVQNRVWRLRARPAVNTASRCRTTAGERGKSPRASRAWISTRRMSTAAPWTTLPRASIGYLNPVTRFTVNYVWAHRESVGDSNVFQGRFQLRSTLGPQGRGMRT